MKKSRLKEDVMVMARADTVEDLQRLLRLAGVEPEQHNDTNQFAVSGTAFVPPVPMMQQPQQVTFESADIDEGWLDREAPPGVERYRPGDRDDMVDVSFGDEDNDGNLRIEDDEEVDEEAGDPGEFDYGHDHMMVRRYDSPAYGRNENGRAPVRYTPARHGDNPLLDDDDKTIEDDDEQKDDYEKALDDSVRRAPQGNRRTHVDREARRIAGKYRKKPDEVSQEIIDQLALKENKRSKIEESIAVLAEDKTAPMVSALRKVKNRLYEQLTADETSHLAAMMINMMRDDNAGRVAHMHQLFQRYLGEADMARAYRDYRKNRR